MKLNIIAFFLTIIFPVFINAQNYEDVEKLMLKRTLDCEDIVFNSIQLIPSYVEQSKIDSALIIAKYWENRCGISEFSTRAKILLSISNNTFNENLYDENIIYYLYLYKKILSSDSLSEPAIYETNEEFKSAIRSYNNFTLSYAKIFLSKTKFESLEYILLKHYSGDTDSTFLYVKSHFFSDKKINNYYFENVRRIINMGYSYIGFFLGQWIPVHSENKVLGTHPEIGLVLGMCRGSSELNLYFHFRFGDTPTPYTFTYEDISRSTKKFSGIGLGFEFGNHIFYTQKQELDLYIGTVLDSYSPPESEDNIDNKGINSGYLSFGLGYGFRLGSFINPTINFQVRYNQYIFNSSGLEGPQGSTMTIRFMLSFNYNDDRKDYLDKISYKFD